MPESQIFFIIVGLNTWNKTVDKNQKYAASKRFRGFSGVLQVDRQGNRPRPEVYTVDRVGFFKVGPKFVTLISDISCILKYRNPGGHDYLKDLRIGHDFS